jgi:AcrR family transcriptional regulator
MDQPVINCRPERKDAAENRQRILDAALRLFEEHGVEPVSMNQIAAEAQIGAGTLYRRYRNKNELCMDLIRDPVDQLSRDIKAYLQDNNSSPPSERLRGLLTLFLQFKEIHAGLIAGVEHSSAALGAHSRTSTSLYEEFHQLLVQLFEEMSLEARQAGPDSVFRADMLMIALSSDSYLFQRNVRGNSQESILDQLCQTFI